MDDIICSLLQAIEESALPYCFAKLEYRQSRHSVEQHIQWLNEHLTDEGKAHLEALRQADLRVVSLECEAEVRLALAAGARLAAPGLITAE